MGCTGIITGGSGGDDAPPEIVPGVHCDDERPGPRQLRLLTRAEYAATVHDLLGVDVDTSSIPVEPRVRGFDNNAAAMAVTSRHLDAFLAIAETTSTAAVKDHRAQVLHCDPVAADCARQFIADFGKRAFRRPLTDDEINGFLPAFQGQTFDDGMGIAIASMMVSPSFLYRWEVGISAGSSSTLTPYETAAALSYLYTGSMPDDELFAAAAADELKTPEQRKAQARRMLATERGHAQVAAFVDEWLRTDGLSANKDAAIYPGFTDDVRRAMAEEQRHFVDDVVFAKNGTFKDLFVSDQVYVNAPLAQFYGLPAPAGDFAPTTAPADSGRGGLLSLGAVLASHAHANESSPVKRGVFVRGRLLCQDLPPPPPTLNTTPPGLDPTLTTRERFSKHSSDPACAGCHQLIDPVGFGFEGFDGVGARRTIENGLPVDMSGAVQGLDSLADATKVPFTDTKGLATVLADSESAQACLPWQYFRYARGYQDDAYDACAIHNLQLDFTNGQLNLQDMFVDLAGLPTFNQRKAI
ncbi:MAG: DUF1592 domain-containing protein [Deltaproteobacteria bacterium]|nr:DUF1592 domain-containing protein [Deltaproteobacteria bacterium]